MCLTKESKKRRKPDAEQSSVDVRRTIKGFTLVEVILVVLVSCVVATSAYRILAAATRAQQRARLMADAYQTLDTAFYVIEKDLNRLVPYAFKGNAFLGGEHEMRMMVVTTEGIMVVRYFMDPSRGGLVRSQQKIIEFLSGQHADPLSTQVIVARKMLRGLRFEFGYLDPADPKNPVWKSRWDQKQLPFIVRVHLDVLERQKSDGIVSFERMFLVPHGDWGVS